MRYLIKDKKLKMLKELEKVYPNELSIGEVAKKTISRATFSTYLKVLCAGRKIENFKESRKGNILSNKKKNQA
jgi:hypothetical protein